MQFWFVSIVSVRIIVLINGCRWNMQCVVMSFMMNERFVASDSTMISTTQQVISCKVRGKGEVDDENRCQIACIKPHEQAKGEVDDEKYCVEPLWFDLFLSLFHRFLVSISSILCGNKVAFAQAS